MNTGQMMLLSEKLGHNLLKEYLPDSYIVVAEVDEENKDKLLNNDKIRVIGVIKNT